MYYSYKDGASIYGFARKHALITAELMRYNPNFNPHQLMLGTHIYLPEKNMQSASNLKEKMRLVWEEHVFWTRLLIVSILNHLPDEDETANRLLRNADDLAAIYRDYYGNEIADIVKSLISEHLLVAYKLVKALAANDQPELKKQDSAWYQNADQIAAGLSSFNPYHNKEYLRKMMYEHLDLTKEEAIKRHNHEYKNEINTFDKIQKQALMMADYLSDGIKKQNKSN